MTNCATGGITIRRLRRDQGIDIRAPRYHPEIVEKLARNRANWTSIWAEEITDSLVREIEDLVGFQNLR